MLRFWKYGLYALLVFCLFYERRCAREELGRFQCCYGKRGFFRWIMQTILRCCAENNGARLLWRKERRVLKSELKVPLLHIHLCHEGI